MKYNKNLSGVQITDEIINRSSSASARLNHDTMLASTVVVRTAAGGGGTLLSLTTDYTLAGEDTRLTTEAGGTVYTTLAVVNGAYHSTPLYVSYKTVGDYAEAEDVIQEFGEDILGKWAKLNNGEKIYAGAGIIESGYVSGRGWYVKYGDGTMEQWGGIASPTHGVNTSFSLPTTFYVPSGGFGIADGVSCSFSYVPSTSELSHTQVWWQSGLGYYYCQSANPLYWSMKGRWKA